MIEIMVSVWCVSFFLSMLTIGISFYLTRKKLRSRTLTNININLEKVGLFWSNSVGGFSPLSPDAIEKDASKTLRSALLMGLFGIASAPGFLLLLIAVASVHILARSRKEIATFRSSLSSDTNLSKQDVEHLVAQFSKII